MLDVFGCVVEKMDKILLDFDNLKLSAFSKYSKLTGDINNVTIGPNSVNNSIISNFQQSSTPKKTVKKTSPKKEKTQDRSPLPLTHVLREFENQRKEKLQEAIGEHYSKFESFSRLQKEEQEKQWIEKQQAFVQSVNENEQVILQTVNRQDLSKTRQNEKLVKHYQDLLQRKLQYQQQLERNKEKQKSLNENIEQLKKIQLEFRSIYQEIISIIKTCVSNEELKNMLGDKFKLLKLLPESFDEIITRCKTYNIGEEQISKAHSIVSQIKNLKIQINEAVSRINKKKQEETWKQETKSKESTFSENVNEKIVSSLRQCVSTVNLNKFTELKNFLSEHAEQFRALMNDDSLKQLRFDFKKAINIPVNAISAVNADHLRDKYVKLNNLLSGKTVSVADKQINASRHPQGIPFCMDLLAKKFVLQGDLMISSNPEAAFCYATIIVSLWNDFPTFGKLLLGYFYTQCPYLVPFYYPRMEEQTDEQYYRSLGYLYVDGQIEKQDKFLKRMTGILRLYFAVMIATPKRSQTKNPHDIKNAWNYLAAILKLTPQLDITATVLHIFLETIGFEMETVYGNAFKKLVRIIMNNFIPVLKKIDTGGPVTRLEVLLQEYKMKGHFDKPNGILSTNFW